MLQELPFHSLFRGGTEGGERTHYLHQCLYCGHSARGGGWKCQDPVITLFRWYYRFLRRRLANSPSAVQEAYDRSVKEKFEEDGLDYNAEMRAVENPVSNDRHTVQTNQPEGSSPVSEPTDFTSEQCLSSQPSLVQTDGLSEPVLQDPIADSSPCSKFKRGDTASTSLMKLTPPSSALHRSTSGRTRPASYNVSTA